MAEIDVDDGEFWISFDQGEPKIFGGPLSDPDDAWHGPVQLDECLYEDMPLISDEQFNDLESRLISMTKFVDTVMSWKADIEAQIIRRRGQERLIPRSEADWKAGQLARLSNSDKARIEAEAIAAKNAGWQLWQNPYSWPEQTAESLFWHANFEAQR